jgi:hypothetical protein
MTPIHDLFVGVVAILFGCMLALGALFNAATLMSLAKPKRLAEAVGNGWARGVIGMVGLAAIAMGVLIASGWRIQW